ncbi:TetR family transcriptional regulator [Acidobacteriota bacterium]
MPAKDTTEPKQRILDAAILLFAKKGFSGVGVREIAKEADVNIAMISYYYEGKVGILKSIIEEYFSRFHLYIANMDFASQSPEENIRELIGNIIEFVRENTELALVMYNELPLDIPEITELKAERISAMIRNLSGLIHQFGIDPGDLSIISMIGPSLIGMIFTNFRAQSVVRQAFGVEIDDAYYERLKGTLSTLFLEGVKGVVADMKENRGRQR